MKNWLLSTPVNSGESLIRGNFYGIQILFDRQSAIEPLRLMGKSAGPILGHNIDVGIGRNCFGNEISYLLSSGSSPKCGWKLQTTALLPVLQYPISFPKRLTPHFRGQSVQALRISASLFILSISVKNRPQTYVRVHPGNLQ